MERPGRAEWIKIRQKRIIDDKEYYADRLYKIRRDATSYARLLQNQDKDVLVLGTTHEGGHRGYAAFVRR